MQRWKGMNRRRRIITTIVGLVFAWGASEGFAWLLSPPVEELVAEGFELFVHEWTPNDPLSGEGDGLGPVFNANSCVACHSQGGIGGGGSNRHNVNAFTVLPTRNDDNMYGGVVHANAISDAFKEDQDQIADLFPMIPGGVKIVGNCQVRFEDFNPVVHDSINTPTLFGSGLIDEISAWTIRRNAWRQGAKTIGDELQGKFHGTKGRVRTLPDGRVGKFGWKAQFASLEEFVATACAVEVGLSNSIRRQDIPRGHKENEEATYDMTNRQLDSLVMFCRKLDRPTEVRPEDVGEQGLAAFGRKLFSDIGCKDCHTPNLGGVDGIYSDLCLHSITDPDHNGYVQVPEVPLPHDVPALNEWKTPPLWGVADTAPYLHDGSAETLEDAIDAHHGDAQRVLKTYKEDLSEQERNAIVMFLKTMKAPASAIPAKNVDVPDDNFLPASSVDAIQ